VTAGRRLASGPGLAAAAVLVTLLFAEGALRLSGYRYSPLKVLTPATGDAATDWRYQHAFESADFTFDPELIWRPVPGRGVFNRQGFRGRETGDEADTGRLRILAVGDSNTLGHQGQRGASWPLLLEALDARLHVINAGVYGYSSFQGRRRLAQSLEQAPDVVLISFGANDGHPVNVSDTEYAQRLARRRGLIRALTASRVGQLSVDAWDKVQALRDRGRPAVRRVALPDYEANLTEMVSLCRARGASPVLLTRPFIGRTHDPSSWKSFGPEYNQATREVAARRGVPLIDVYKEFKRSEQLFEDESHFTPQGHWEAARFVHAQLRPVLDALPTKAAGGPAD
jgi:lysophospholipase L1-like esterase